MPVPSFPGLPPGLIADLAAVEQSFPGWHVWLSDEGRVYAVRIRTSADMAAHQRRYGGLSTPAGITLDADDAPSMRREIASHVEEYRAWAA